MSSTEEGGGTVGAPGRAVSTDQTIINNNPLETIIPIQCTNFLLSNGELENLRLLDEAFNGSQVEPTSNPLIQRVPSTLGRHKDFRKYFKPKVISIGPLHHDDPTLHGSEKLKLKLAAHFVKNIGVNKETLYNNMKTEINELKKCYDPKELEKYSNDDEKLAWMFFVDGCAILQAIYMRYGNDDVDGQDNDQMSNELSIKNDLLTYVYLDLFLLENQLPFRVLKLLTSWSENGEKFMKAIKRFIDDNVITPAEMKEPQSHQQDSERWQQQEEEPIHLLNLLRQRLLFKTEEKRKPWRHCRFCTRLFRYLINRSNRTRAKRHHSHTFRNVKELKNAGIWLKASETSCLTDISFNRIFFVGKLWLPPITVDDSTGPKFMNLIAHEMCPDFYNNFTVTSYICFLDSLIDEAEDVKDLRDAGILSNGLGSDEEVAKLFNKMNTDLVPSQTIYSGVKRQIHNHCKNMWINYAAQAYHTHFRSPWTFLAFVGAIAALLLSALQTYYTIHQPNKDSSNHKN
ncbi:hypothetical protein ERO13_D11G323900v2 [Gossypium hirsutum]|uniref:UPF0481 protein At3g47200 n=1 Tax=Gossypium hirsutum TaxID=3635 RepID=A0A1U8LBI0_GOSHI|nr:UPF0481 protein At3g47200-like [Gossypium hirsutum]KAG4123387.1 hypothetical protein ERO13_D11G323900v2 [Gossypium hirsutum]